MQASPEQVMEFISHPDIWVRRMALGYFTDTFWRGPEVARTTIAAIEQFGPEDPFWFTGTVSLTRLGLDDESFKWVIKNYDKLIYNGALGQSSHGLRIFQSADIELVRRNIAAVAGIKALSKEQVRSVEQRIELDDLGAHKCWDLLHEHCHKHGEEENYSKIEMPYMHRLVDTCARGDETIEAKLITFLAEDYNDEDIMVRPELGWLEPMLARMAGEMRLTSAAPHLAWRLFVEGELLVNEVLWALAKIGGKDTILAILKEINASEVEDIAYGVEAIGYIHSDMTAEVLLELAYAFQQPQATWMSHYAVSQLDEEALTDVHDMVRCNDWDEDVLDLRADFVSAATIMNYDYPEKAQWRKLVEDAERIGGKGLRDDDDGASNVFQMPVATTTRTGPNEPCPCGSGKKFKKCCMRAMN